MFQPGDLLRYTGKYRNACHDIVKIAGREGWVFRGGTQNRDGGVIYAESPDGQLKSTAFYCGDMEAMSREPEAYEGWFV